MNKDNRIWAHMAFSPDDENDCGRGWYVDLCDREGRGVGQTELHATKQAAKRAAVQLATKLGDFAGWLAKSNCKNYA